MLGKAPRPSGKLDVKWPYRHTEGIPLTLTSWHQRNVIGFRISSLMSLLLVYCFRRNKLLHIQGVSGGIVNILGGGSMDYSE